MQVSARSIQALGRIVTGDEGLSRYRSGQDLVRLFNEFGANDLYGSGFPSRWDYAEQKIRHLNGTPALASLMKEVLDPREFLDEQHSLPAALEYINRRLKFDGYEVVLYHDGVKIRNAKGSHVEVKHPFEGSAQEGHLFINEQIEKCERKIQEGDYDGAVTNARSLTEAVLTELERNLDPNAPEYDGDLIKLYKRVQKLLNLEPSRPDIDTQLKQVLTGLVSIMHGLASLRNRISDAHVRSYKPAKHHAVLVVNAAKTIVNFLFDTSEYQRAVRPKEPQSAI